MKVILCIIFVIMLSVTGCSNENKTVETENNSDDSNIIAEGESTDDSNVFTDDVLHSSWTEEDLSENSEGDEIIIRDKLFIAQCNDIYLNTDEYIGKTIKWEGIYTESTNPDTNETFKFVIRYGPGCCGNDGVAGFEILYDEETPNLDDWVEAVGKIEMIEENGNEFVAIRLSKLTVLDVRGQELVSN